MDRRDFIKSGIAAMGTLAVGEVIHLWPNELVADDGPPLNPTAKPRRKRRPKQPNDYTKATKVTSVCLNCSSICGIVGYVIDGKVVKISGNPLDPNSGIHTCAKGQSGPTVNVYSERLLYPLKRVGGRGEGLWKRITWEEAYSDIAARINKCIDEEVPEQVVFHQGRNRLIAETDRFLRAIGTPTLLNHRAICSSNKRAANYVCIGDTDWETIDAESCRYFLNFGSNFYECHQGGLHLVRRVVKARFDHGAKLVTFDVRLSNTAGRSDEWFAPFPGTEGAIALAMGHVILRAGRIDEDFLSTWINLSVTELKDFYQPYTPAWAEKISGIKAGDIARVALEFAERRPACAAFTNRGAGAHYNGFNNERAVVMLNALVGSVGKPGGYCYGEAEKLDPKIYPSPQPIPPRVTKRTDLEDPPEWPLANRWQKMKVGQIVYPYLQQGRAKVQVYISYVISSPTTWPEGRSNAVAVLKDERLIPFHVCSDVVYSEMAHYADLILPDATYLERWGLETRNNYELRPYVALRQPMVEPPAECQSFADSMFEIGRRLRPQAAKYFQFGNHEAFVRAQCANIPKGDATDGFAYMKKYGASMDASRPKSYEMYKQRLTKDQLRNTWVDKDTGVIYQRQDAGADKAVGIMIGEVPCRGFKTPSRRFEIHVQDVVNAAKKVGLKDDGLPHYVPIPAHQNLPADRFILTTFKWNVHTQARTATQKYLSEIVHDNPMWINVSVARKLGIKNGDLVEITTYRPLGHTFQATGEKLGSARIRVFVTEGIHPRVFAISNSVGQLFGGRAATSKEGPRPEFPGYGGADDDMLQHDLWWDKRRGGRGNGTNVNAILPINPQPLVGMQAWFDTVCAIRKVTST